MALTLEQFAEYTERIIAEKKLSGDRVALLNAQRAAGMVVAAAEAIHDSETARRFRILASHAANASEELDKSA